MSRFLFVCTQLSGFNLSYIFGTTQSLIRRTERHPFWRSWTDRLNYSLWKSLSESSIFYENEFNCARHLTCQTLWLFFLFLSMGKVNLFKRFHTQSKDGANTTRLRPTKRNRHSHNDDTQKHKSKSPFPGWRDGLLQHCSRCAARGHINPYLFIICLDYVPRTSIEFKSWTECISHCTNTLGKGMNPIILPPAMGK